MKVKNFCSPGRLANSIGGACEILGLGDGAPCGKFTLKKKKSVHHLKGEKASHKVGDDIHNTYLIKDLGGKYTKK